MEEMKTKRCSKCGETKDVSEFHNNKKNRDGYEYSCKKCKIEYKRLWRKNNKGKYALHQLRGRLRKKYGVNTITDEMVNEYNDSIQNRKSQITEEIRDLLGEEYTGTPEERIKTRRRIERRKMRKIQIRDLCDPYLKKSLRKQYGINNIPEGLIEFKRASLTAKREIKKHKDLF